MWTIENRARYDRSKLRCPSDLTDEEWSHVEPLIRPGKRGGNKRTVNVREVVNGLMYILSTGRRGRLADGRALRALSVSGEALRRWRIPGTSVPTCDQKDPAAREPLNREALGSGERVCRSPEALDCRTHHSLAEPLPSTGQGLGEPQLQGARLPPPCLDPPHAANALQSRMMFPDRLLEPV